MAERLRGKVAVISGAGGGIGGAAVRRFLQEGASVVAVDRAVDAINALQDPQLEVVSADVTSSADVQRVFTTALERFGRVDVLFNVVGASGRRMGDGPIDECTEEGWAWVLDVNLRSVFLMCKYGVPVLRQSGGGSIINLGSVLGLVGHELFATHAYAASKGAVVSLTRAMAVQYSREHIRVNALCPGLIRTPMSLRAQADPIIQTELEELQPLTGTFGEPDDVAEAAVYLASDESRFVTGVILPVDGGWTAR